MMQKKQTVAQLQTAMQLMLAQHTEDKVYYGYAIMRGKQ
jgi:hypothetical protein